MREDAKSAIVATLLFIGLAILIPAVVSDASLQSRLQIAAYRKSLRMEILLEAPELAARVTEIQERRREERSQLKDQLKNGSAGSAQSQAKSQNNKGNGGCAGGLWNSFTGNQ